MIDNQALDVWLSDLLNIESLLGLVPSISWLMDERERIYTQEKVFSLGSDAEIIPVLVCPDDQDLSCTVLVAEVVVENQIVIWTRIGMDQSPAEFPQRVGVNVNWFNEVPQLRFDLDKYVDCWKRIEKEA